MRKITASVQIVDWSLPARELYNHTKLHSKAVFICGKCQYSTNQKGNLRRHESTKHVENDKEIINEKDIIQTDIQFDIYKCNKCPCTT